MEKKDTEPAFSSPPIPSPQVYPPTPESSQQQRFAIGYKIKKVEFAGIGAAVQAIGFGAFLIGVVLCITIFGMLFGIISIIIGVMLLIVGSSMSIKLICSNCGNKISGKEVRICPVCHCHFDK